MQTLLKTDFMEKNIYKSEEFFLKAIEKEHETSLFNYANGLKNGVIGKEKIFKSEEFFLITSEIFLHSKWILIICLSFLKSGKLSVFTREISNFLFKFLNKLQI
jgi:hypothetical protein